MSGGPCKQVLCLEKLRALLRATDRISRLEDIKPEDQEAIIECAENAAADLDKILSGYT